MASAQTIEAICQMPAELRRRGDVSMVQLLRESGYLDNPSQITEALLQRYLKAHPEAIESWLNESEDQRTSQGWYLRDPKASKAEGSWVVGFHPGGPSKTYADGTSACAAFIKHYVDRLSTHAQNAS